MEIDFIDLMFLIMMVLLFIATILLVFMWVYMTECEEARRKDNRRKSAPRKKTVNPKAKAIYEASSQNLDLNLTAMSAARKMADAASRNIEEDDWD